MREGWKRGREEIEEGDLESRKEENESKERS